MSTMFESEPSFNTRYLSALSKLRSSDNPGHLTLEMSARAASPHLYGTQSDAIRAHYDRICREVHRIIRVEGNLSDLGGGFGSVNHFHLHLVQSGRLPVEQLCWTHLGGSEPYPIDIDVFDDASKSFQWIAARQDVNRPFNLLYAGDRVYCFSRGRRQMLPKVTFTTGFAFYELSGVIFVPTYVDYQAVTVDEIVDEFARNRDSAG